MNSYSQIQPAAVGGKVLGPIVFAVDAAYAVPLATALRSLAENNEHEWPLDIQVIHEGIGEAAKRRILASLPNASCSIRWHPIDTLSLASKFCTRPGVSKMTFARLVLPRFLPAACRRVLYLDGDILALGALDRLWNVDLGDAILAAVPDYCLDCLAEGRRASSSRRYFNAGVLVIDLERWRDERVSERALDYLDQNPDAEYSDQDALNFVCEGKWKVLDRTWNFQFEPSQSIARTAVEQKVVIVHFVTNVKPWKPGSLSSNVAFYDAYRSRTSFALTARERAYSGLRRVCARILARSPKLKAALAKAKTAMWTPAAAHAQASEVVMIHGATERAPDRGVARRG